MTSKLKVKLSEVFNKAFVSVWKLAKVGEVLRIVCKGGRGSGKSTHIAIIIILLMMMFPISALVVRKVKDTLRDSCLEDLKEAIAILKVEDKWKVHETPTATLIMVYKPRGNKILFRGGDKPEKIKSIKASKFPLMLLWVEELAEFRQEEEITIIENSILRKEPSKGLFYLFFYSYNPPKRKQNWVNKKFETQFIQNNTIVHHSSYLDNPHISQAFIDEAEEVKKNNPAKYAQVYMGEPIGAGVQPFNNLEFREITDAEYNSFDNIRQGLDWGYANDPLALVRWHYDKTKRTIYAMAEFGDVKVSNRALAKHALENGYQNYMTTTDVSPRDVNELVTEHMWNRRNIRQAVKGGGSVEYGEEWLDDLEAIVIDPKRTPKLAWEFENIDYETDKDGNPKNRLEDKDNHYIDATRYAFEEDMLIYKKPTTGAQGLRVRRS